MRLTRPTAFALLMLSTTGCDKFDCQWNKSDADLVSTYKDMSLEAIYNSHMNFTSRCTPPRTSLATLLANFGPRARAYAILQIESGNYRSLNAALSVTAHVTARSNSDCSSYERYHLGRELINGIPLAA